MTATPLTRRQILISAGIGAVLFLVFALLITLVGPMGVFDGMNRVWLYLAAIPITWPTPPMLRRLAGLAPDQHALGMAVGTAAATLLDGLALAWTPWLYADTIELVAAAGAVILWGAGVGLALGLVFDRRAR